MATCPFRTARQRAVLPAGVVASKSAPDSTSNRAMSRWPFRAARHSGVKPSQDFWLTLEPAVTRSRAVSRSPSQAARHRGGRPSSCRPSLVDAKYCTTFRTLLLGPR
eukprot:scaffold432472_cov27-Prasinocladus_malaysianus.AAC.1